MSALLCRTSDRAERTAEGARSLAEALAERLGVDARLIGAPGLPADTDWAEDVRENRGCILEAGGQLEDAMGAGRFPVITSSDCTICMSTLPALARARPDAWVLWLDAHPDFNDPDSTPSGFLGGMCLAAACGVWSSGLDDSAPLDPSRVVMCGVRDVDPGEQVLLATHGVGRVERPSELAGLLEGRPVFVHLDLDVLDPTAMPGQHWPVDGGFSDGGLRTLLAEVAGACEVLGLEITNLPQPTLARRIATICEPLLP